MSTARVLAKLSVAVLPAMLVTGHSEPASAFGRVRYKIVTPAPSPDYGVPLYRRNYRPLPRYAYPRAYYRRPFLSHMSLATPYYGWPRW